MRISRAAPAVALSLFFLAASSPGEDARPAYLNGHFPPHAPRESDPWTLVKAFPNLAFKDMTGLFAAPRSNKLYVLTRQGQLWWFENAPSQKEKHLFIDLTAHCQGWDDSGLLGLAFHPDFGLEGKKDRGHVYIWYMHTDHPIVTPRGRPNAPPADMTDRLSRFTVPDGQDAIDPDSELVLIDQHDRHLWHNGGGMFFTEEGFLYLSLGDEGADFGNENHIDRSLFSGVLRIDVDENAERSHPIKKQPLNGKTAHYFVPNDNPWVGVPNALEEFWAIGFRNPHRMTYDPVTRRIWTGDVGDATIEEVDVVEKGCNYQWRWKEGTRDHGPRPAKVVGTEKGPIWEYDRSQGYCVIGGYVYRGEELRELVGKYIFGDLSGAIWALEETPGKPVRAARLATLPQAPNVSYGLGLTSFGIDNKNELYLLQFGDEGHIFKLARAEHAPVAPPRLLSETGAFTDLATLEESKDLVPYDVVSPLWSDGASKKRWVSTPSPAQFSENEAWRFPQGAVFVKHFERDGRRLETRFLVVGEEVYGLTYRWREDQKDAVLLSGTTPEPGPDGWTFPSRDDCLKCHTSQAGYILGGRTRQLARAGQLEAWQKAGLVTVPAGAHVEPLADPRDEHAPLEARARSYLDANCMHCHAPNGSARGWFDARATTPLADTGIVDGVVAEPLGLEDARVVRSGDPAHSVLVERLRRTDERRMPPLAVGKIDEAGARLLEEWVRSLPKTPLPPAHGLHGEYYAGVNFERLVAERDDPFIDFNWTDHPPATGLGTTDFSVRWRGTLEIPRTGEWALHISTDDGGRLFVGGRKVIDRWRDQPETEAVYKLHLEEGQEVPLVFEYYQRGGAAIARLFWSGPGQPKALIPPSRLTPWKKKRWL